MANKYSKKQTGAKTNIDLSALNGGKKYNKRQKKKVVKTAKSIGFRGILIVVLFLLIGVGVGVGAMFIVSKDDCFMINGEDEISIAPNDLYEDEGCKIIAFGKDISNEVIVETDLLIDEDGSFYAVENGDYFIKYTTTDLKYGKLFVVQKFRIIHVSDKIDEGGALDEK